MSGMILSDGFPKVTNGGGLVSILPWLTAGRW